MGRDNLRGGKQSSEVESPDTEGKKVATRTRQKKF